MVTPLAPLTAAAPAAGRATMRDVAALAGVSLKTVSRVVNGAPTVDAGLAARVRRAAAQLNYQHNMTASNLRRGDRRSFMIGLMLEDMANPYSSVIYRAVEDAARARGVGVLAGSLDEDPARERELAATLVARRVDGLIIVPTRGSHDYLVSEIEAGVATVFVLRPPELVRADAVLPDERGGAHAAIEHLVAQGHRKIGFLGGPDGHRSGTLRAGCAEALAAAGLPVDQALLNLNRERLASADLSAVFCADQEYTRAAIRAVLPRRVAIVGFGDFPLADLVSPPVSVVSYDPVRIGRTAGELLIRRLAGDQTPPRRVEVPVRLIAR